MAKYTHEICVEREVNGEETELNLKVELEIDPFVQGKCFGAPESCYPDEGGFAEITGSILVLNEDGEYEPWDGELTEAEVSEVETEAYRAWEEAEEDAGADASVESFEDRFDILDDDRVLNLVGGGKVFF